MAQAAGQEPKELNTALGIKARGSKVKIHRGTQMPPCLEWSLVSLRPRLRKTASYLTTFAVLSVEVGLTKN